MGISSRRTVAYLLVLGLSGCASSPRFAEKEGKRSEGVVPPKETPTLEPANARPSTGRVLLTLEGVASYYAQDFHGKQAANGEIFDMNDLTAAHRTFPFGTKIRVTNLENKLQVVVRVNDRGPYVEGRLIDLSLGAAKQINLIKTGTTRVRLDVIEWGDGKLYH
ncbi:MAG: septal ring lytic transglycosylase RlpA family protein [Bacteroidota bacterium]